MMVGEYNVYHNKKRWRSTEKGSTGGSEYVPSRSHRPLLPGFSACHPLLTSSSSMWNEHTPDKVPSLALFPPFPCPRCPQGGRDKVDTLPLSLLCEPCCRRIREVTVPFNPRPPCVLGKHPGHPQRPASNCLAASLMAF